MRSLDFMFYSILGIDFQYKLQCVNVCDLSTLEEKCLSLNDLFGNAGIPGINNNTIGVMFFFATIPGKML